MSSNRMDSALYTRSRKPVFRWELRTWFLCSLTVYDIKWVYVSASNENIDFRWWFMFVCGGVLLWQCGIIIKRFINLWSMKFPRCYSKLVITSSFNEEKLTFEVFLKFSFLSPSLVLNHPNNFEWHFANQLFFFFNPLTSWYFTIDPMTWYGNHETLSWLGFHVVSFASPSSRGFDCLAGNCRVDFKVFKFPDDNEAT